VLGEVLTRMIVGGIVVESKWVGVCYTYYSRVDS
jgi:hypothetical protein